MSVHKIAIEKTFESRTYIIFIFLIWIVGTKKFGLLGVDHYKEDGIFAKLYNKLLDGLSRGSGQVVSVLALYSDDSSSNHAKVYNFL